VIFAIILSSTLFANENAKESKIKPITLGQYESPEAEESCLQNVLDYLIRNIFSPNEHLLYDYQKKTDFFYHGRLRRAFEAVPDSVLDELFDSKTGLIKSEKELFRIWELIQGDYIKATPAQVEFIGDLYHVNDDYAGIFWNDEVNRAFDVLSTLMKADKKMLLIRTQLQQELSSYEIHSPAVTAAKRMQQLGYNVKRGIIVSYVIVKGADMISNRAKIPEEITEGESDPEYYVEHQVIASVEKIFEAVERQVLSKNL